jgi:hypothetical protein
MRLTRVAPDLLVLVADLFYRFRLMISIGQWPNPGAISVVTGGANGGNGERTMGRHEAPREKWVRRGVWATIFCAVATLVGAGATLAAPAVSSWFGDSAPAHARPTPAPEARHLTLELPNGGKLSASNVMVMVIADADLAVGEYGYVLVQAQGDPVWHVRECRKAGVGASCGVRFAAVGAPAWWNVVGVVVTSDGETYLASNEQLLGDPRARLATWLLGVTDLGTVSR